MYWKHFVVISVALFRSCNWNLKELLNVTNFLSKLMSYVVHDHRENRVLSQFALEQ